MRGRAELFLLTDAALQDLTLRVFAQGVLRVFRRKGRPR